MKTEAARITAEAKASLAVARGLAPLAKEPAYRDLKKLPAILAKVRTKLGAGVPPGVTALLDELDAWTREAPELLRRDVGRGLKALCEARGIPLTVVSREDPVKLRLPPFAVEIDFRSGKATIGFALTPIATTRADAGAILGLRDEIMKEWDAGFDPEKFHERCRRAWRACRAAEEQAEERVEILRFLPHLALQMQGEKFAVDPSPKTFRGYGRARFAYDIASLRRLRRLDQRGFRLNLGVATGSSAQEKKRVVYFEDENGVGEYKLTVYFTRSEGES